MTAKSAANPERILQAGLGFWASRALLSAVEMELFTELAGKSEDLEILQGRLGLHPRSARDFLAALVALGFLKRSGGKYSNSEDADFFLDKGKASYIGGILEMAGHRLYGFWNDLTTALRTGEQQNEAKGGGESPFVALYADPLRLKQFLASMTGVSRGANQVIAQKAPWRSYRTFADLGTAQGDLAVHIALANPHLTGIGFDLAVVGPIFEEYVKQSALDGRVRFMAGDFFEDPLPKVDVITMGHILHDWNLDEKKALIAKVYHALDPGGALVVYDSIIDDDRSANAFGLLMSLNMLIETPGGFDYTGADCIGWMKEAGFREAHVEHLTGPD
jgi:SAM-dependent methyltransferase